MQTSRFTASLAALLALAGCAAGSALTETTEGMLSTTPIDAGDSKSTDNSARIPEPTDTTGDDDATDAGTDEDAAPTATTDAGTDAGGGGGGACGATNTCMAATNMGTVRGDTGSDTFSATGSTSQWLTVRVDEADNNPFAVPEWLKATLTSPPGANFDLYVYVPSSDTRECSLVTKTAVSATSPESASVAFGESGTLANGNDDSRTVTLEVRWVSGTCSPTSTWKLDVFGNQQ